MADMFASMSSGMLDAATSLNRAISGSFSIDIEGAQQLLTFVKGMQQAVAQVRENSMTMSETPQLGTTPAANTYKSYLPTIATDQHQGLVPVMDKLHQQLNQAATNIQNSIAQYKESDQGSQQGFLNIHNVFAV